VVLVPNRPALLAQLIGHGARRMPLRPLKEGLDFHSCERWVRLAKKEPGEGRVDRIASGANAGSG